MPMLVSIPSVIIEYASKDGVEAIEEDCSTSGCISTDKDLNL